MPVFVQGTTWDVYLQTCVCLYRGKRRMCWNENTSLNHKCKETWENFTAAFTAGTYL
jgi:hypothetical protein